MTKWKLTELDSRPGDDPGLLLQVQEVNLESLAKPPPKEATPREKRLLRSHWAGAPAEMPAEAPVYEGDRDVLGFAHDAEKGRSPGFCLRLYAWIADEQKKQFGEWDNNRPISMVRNSYKHILESGSCPLCCECRHYAESCARREGKIYQTKMKLK